MVKKSMRIFAVIAACIALIACLFLSACSFARDGRDGEDLTLMSMMEEVNEELIAQGKQPYTSILDFVEDYFGYVSDEAQEAVSEKSIINYSLLSSVAIVSEFSSGSLFEQTYSVFTGSGVIVDIDRQNGDAYIVTNAHVVCNTEGSQTEYCNSIYAYLYGSDVMDVDYFVYNNVGVRNINGIDASDIEIVGVSLTYDLAVLRVEGSEVLARSNAVAASFSEDEVFAVGERVYAIGNPQWEGLSATRGIISRESQNIHLDIATTAFRVMRTDAAINGGNSGGGLFNMRGELVGIVNSGAASVIEEDGVTINDIDNMSYALPATYARRVVQSMIDRYEENNRTFYDVRKATLGVTSVVTDSYARYDGELGETVIEQTVAVDSVSAQPAMGVLRSGDILKGFSVGVVQTAIADGAYTQKNSAFSVPEDTGFRVARHYFSLDVERSYTVTDAMFAVRQGDTVEIVIERNGQTMYAYITFDSANYFRTYS